MQGVRAPAIALVALLVAACSGLTPTVGPPAQSVGPSATTAATESPLPSAVPTPTAFVATCPTGTDTVPAALSLHTPTGFESIELGEDPLPSADAIDPADVPIVSTVLGNTGLPLELVGLDGPDRGLSITGMTADFLPFGTATTLPVKVTLDGPTGTVVLPDRDVSGQLRLSATWTSDCGEGAGTGSLALEVVKSSVAAGCPTTSDGLQDAVVAFAGTRITVGTLSITLVVTGWSGRWTEGVGATDGPEFGTWDQNRTTVVGPGESVQIRESVADLGLVSVFAQLFRRADVLDYLDADSTGELDTVMGLRRNANLNGRANIPMPLETGRYVLRLQGTWLTSCLSVETLTSVSVDVR
jgi:hypothetical protein